MQQVRERVRLLHRQVCSPGSPGAQRPEPGLLLRRHLRLDGVLRRNLLQLVLVHPAGCDTGHDTCGGADRGTGNRSRQRANARADDALRHCGASHEVDRGPRVLVPLAQLVLHPLVVRLLAGLRLELSRQLHPLLRQRHARRLLLRGHREPAHHRVGLSLSLGGRVVVEVLLLHAVDEHVAELDVVGLVVPHRDAGVLALAEEATRRSGVHRLTVALLEPGEEARVIPPRVRRALGVHAGDGRAGLALVLGLRLEHLRRQRGVRHRPSVLVGLPHERVLARARLPVRSVGCPGRVVLVEELVRIEGHGFTSRTAGRPPFYPASTQSGPSCHGRQGVKPSIRGQQLRLSRLNLPLTVSLLEVSS